MKWSPFSSFHSIGPAMAVFVIARRSEATTKQSKRVILSGAKNLKNKILRHGVYPEHRRRVPQDDELKIASLHRQIQFKHRQKHRNHDEADHEPHPQDHEGLQERGHDPDRFVGLLLIIVRDFAHRLVELSGLLTHRHKISHKKLDEAMRLEEHT